MSGNFWNCPCAATELTWSLPTTSLPRSSARVFALGTTLARFTSRIRRQVSRVQHNQLIVLKGVQYCRYPSRDLVTLDHCADLQDAWSTIPAPILEHGREARHLYATYSFRHAFECHGGQAAFRTETYRPSHADCCSDCIDCGASRRERRFPDAVSPEALNIDSICLGQIDDMLVDHWTMFVVKP